MGAFVFRKNFKSAGDQQKDAITQIEIMQERAVQAYLNWMTSQGKNTFTTRLLELRAELDALIDAMVSHTAVFKKKADGLELLIGHYETLAKAGGFV
ncbi:TPA: hypothetical protein SI588_003228 [Escherichia coli]|nr:hypothetical protein [Escherichia coli]HBC2947094.1 hypothetical protein [Escherichia coli O146]HDQ6492537.1 hypothetical protein [Escherichia coli Ou:H16]MBB8029255.1 hypothetical protein [Escherichia coli]MBB8072682.1 hypothetical protein [Escherichia coli]